MGRGEEQGRWFGMVASLVGALTGQRQLSAADRQGIAEWVVDHSDEPEVRELLVKVVMTQIIDTSEFREQVAEAIRKKFESEE